MKKVLKEIGVKTNTKVYDNVKHGFIEENNPEYEKQNKRNKIYKSPEAEEYIKEWINKTK